MQQLSSHWKAILSGLISGACNGLFGGGGGALLVPMLTSFCGLKERQAFATSIAIILPLCSISLLVYLLQGELQWNIALPYVLGGLLGGWMGGSWFPKIQVLWLKRGFALFLLYGGLQCLI